MLKKIRIVAIVLVFFLIITTVYNGISDLNSSKNRVMLAENRLKEAKEEQDELKMTLEEVKSEFFKEKQARDKLGLAREGDIVVVLPEEDLLRRLSPRVIEEDKNELSEPNWKKWMNLFFEI